MTGSCIAHGLRTGRRNLSLVALLWFWTALLAALAALPAWAWLRRGFDFAPESDRMLSGFSFMTLGELAQYDRSSVGSLFSTAVLGVALVALLANPLLSGGLIENLMARDSETTLRRFLRGAGRFFWRYLRLLAYAIVTGGIVLAVLAAALAPLTRKLSESSWEPGTVGGGLLLAAVLFLAGGLMLTALDFARARIAGNDSHRVLRTWLSSLLFVLRRTPSALALFLVPTAIFAVIAGLYAVYLRFVPAHTALLILALFLVQQAVMFCRASLRVSLVASVLEYHRETALPPSMSVGAPEEPVGAIESAPTAEPVEQAPEEHTEPGAAPDATAVRSLEDADETSRN